MRGGMEGWGARGRNGSASAMLDRFSSLGGLVGRLVTNVFALLVIPVMSGSAYRREGLFKKLKPHETGGSDGAKEEHEKVEHAGH